MLKQIDIFAQNSSLLIYFSIKFGKLTLIDFSKIYWTFSILSKKNQLKGV